MCCAGFLQFDEDLSRKDYVKRKWSELVYDWQCPTWWHDFAHVIELFIMDAFVDLFITLCIVINTAFMAVDHAGMSDELANVLIIGNYVRLNSTFTFLCSFRYFVLLLTHAICYVMRCDALQYNAMQCNATQYNTIQYNTIQYTKDSIYLIAAFILF